MKNTKLIFKLFLLSLVFVSCSKNDIAPSATGKYAHGVLVSAEGNFQHKDGSISYVNENLTTTTKFIYEKENGAKLGGLIQSITFSKTNAYIILNDVNTIVVADRYTFKKKATISTGLKNPRYMAISNGKGYITNWGDGANKTDDYLAILDLATNTIESTKIPLDNGVEQILAKNNKLYVSHKGAFTSNNIISVVNLMANNAVTKITVKDNPDEMAFDDSGDLIVLCEGKPLTYGTAAVDYAVLTNTPAAIEFIKLSDNTIKREIPFGENKRATFLSYANGKIYYYKKSTEKVYSIDEVSTTLPADGTGISVGSIHGMSVKDNNLFTVKYTFTELSTLTVTDLTTKVKKYTAKVGLGSSKIYFN